LSSGQSADEKHEDGERGKERPDILFPNPFIQVPNPFTQGHENDLDNESYEDLVARP
jgi:hypothetical protein